jgi:hypothetical protein
MILRSTLGLAQTIYRNEWQSPIAKAFESLLRSLEMSLATIVLLILASAPTYSQTSHVATQAIYTQSIQLNYLKAGSVPSSTLSANECSQVDGETAYFIKLLRYLLSAKGLAEIDSRANTVIVTDTRANLNLAERFIRVLDQPQLSLAELCGKTAVSEELVTLMAHVQNLDFSIHCGPGGDASRTPKEEGLQGQRSFALFALLLSRRGSIEFDGRWKTLTVNDEPRRTQLITEVVQMLDEFPSSPNDGIVYR